MIPESIAYALSNNDATDLPEALKAAVTRELQAIDPATKISHTDYFNHTFVPDLIIKWSGTKQGERQIFIRRYGNSPQLVEDIELLGDSGPMFFGLETKEIFRRVANVDIPRALAQHQDTLVTEGSALQNFKRVTAMESLLDTVGSAIVRGGRGTIYEEEALTFRTATSNALGVDGSPVPDVQQVSLALELIEDNLQPSFASSIRRYVRLVWLAHGGAPEEFPSDFEDGAIDQEEIVSLLRYLFHQDPIEDNTFWRRVGQHVDLTTFEALKEQEPHPNLHTLIQANSDRLVARMAAVKRWINESLREPLSWRIGDGFLQLVTPNLELRFAESGERFTRTGISPGPRLQDFVKRAGQRRILSLETESASLKVDVQAKGDEGVDEAFESLSVALGASSRVQSAKVVTAGSEATCNFRRRRFRIDDHISIHRIALEAAVLLLGLGASELEALASFLQSGRYTASSRIPRSKPETPTLFDIDDQDGVV